MYSRNDSLNLKQYQMKQIYLLTAALFFSLVVNAQTFTIGQGTTGMTQNVYGQGFTPSIQGNGTGEVGTESMVGLYEFSFMLDDTEIPDVLYIYEVLPDNAETLMDGSGGTVVGQSTGKVEERFWYTNYTFDGLALDKDKMYYALFREAVNCEVGGGDYAGGNIYRPSDGELNTTEYANTRFKASFAPPVTSGFPESTISSLSIFPNPTDGDITISSEVQTVIYVYEFTGVKVKTFYINAGQNQRSIADLPKGIYLFKCEGEGGRKVVKN